MLTNLVLQGITIVVFYALVLYAYRTLPQEKHPDVDFPFYFMTIILVGYVCGAIMCYALDSHSAYPGRALDTVTLSIASAALWILTALFGAMLIVGLSTKRVISDDL